MTADPDISSDEELAIQLSNIQISLDTAAEGLDCRPPPIPRTPLPTPVQQARPRLPHIPPHVRSHRTYTGVTAATDNTLYHYESPSQNGLTRQWSRAAAATQGVPGGHVYAIPHGGSPSKRKKHTIKAAYIVYAGTDTGVLRTWMETQRLVKGVRNCIFRGYASLSDADNAWAYALARHWVRKVGDPLSSSMHSLPQPIQESDGMNPLNGSEEVDDTWYVVYRGITPGVYRSHLECQLNTLGVRGAVHESIIGRANALAKFAGADGRPGEIVAASPPAYSPRVVE